MSARRYQALQERHTPFNREPIVDNQSPSHKRPDKQTNTDTKRERQCTYQLRRPGTGGGHGGHERHRAGGHQGPEGEGQTHVFAVNLGRMEGRAIVR